jgi:hypothetical protein
MVDEYTAFLKLDMERSPRLKVEDISRLALFIGASEMNQDAFGVTLYTALSI